MKRAWIGWMAGLLCALPLLAAAQEPTAATPEAVDAVWVEREVNFTYMPLTSYYSCDGLRDKVRWIFRQLGARSDLRVSTRGCMEARGPEFFPGVRIVAAFPAAATPEVLAQVASDAAQRQLDAKGKGKGKAQPVADPTVPFPARAKRVEFRSSMSAGTGLQDGDCELMEQLRDQVFGQYGIRVVEERIHCVPRTVTIGAVRMTVEVLEPVPAG